MAPQNLDAKVLLFKLLVRQENKNTSYEKEEEDILEQLDELYDKRRFYLRGFRFWKKHDFNNAIEQFSLGKQAGDDSIPIHRDLAECYFQINELQKAKEEISLVIKPKRKITNAFILDLAAKIAIYSGDFQSAKEIISQLDVVDKPENVNHRKATLAIKEKRFDDALSDSNNACCSDRVLPQMLLLNMNIAIHSNQFDLVEQDYTRYQSLFKQYSKDMLEVLYSTMLLKRDGWQSATAGFSKIRNKDRPIAINLKYKILQKKLEDRKLSISERNKTEEKLKSINIDTTRDVLDVNQYYEYRDDDMIDRLR